MHPDPQQLEDLVRRIVEAVHPLKIVLFGSAARGEMRPESDLDVMVVMPEGAHHRKVAQYLHRHFYDVGLSVGVDVVVATPGDLAEYGDDIGYVYHRILREGKELYAA